MKAVPQMSDEVLESTARMILEHGFSNTASSVRTDPLEMTRLVEGLAEKLGAAQGYECGSPSLGRRIQAQSIIGIDDPSTKQGVDKIVFDDDALRNIVRGHLLDEGHGKYADIVAERGVDNLYNMSLLLGSSGPEIQFQADGGVGIGCVTVSPAEPVVPSSSPDVGGFTGSSPNRP